MRSIECIDVAEQALVTLEDLSRRNHAKAIMINVSHFSLILVCNPKASPFSSNSISTPVLFRTASPRASSISTSSLCPHSAWPFVWPPTVLPSFLLSTFTSSSNSSLSSRNASSVVSPSFLLVSSAFIIHSMPLQRTANAWSPSVSSSHDSSKMSNTIRRNSGKLLGRITGRWW